MDCVSPILNAATCLWDRSSKYRVYVCDLEQNLESLRGAMIRLKAISEDVKTRVQVEEEKQMSRRTNQVSGWLQSTEEMGKEVTQILERGDKEIQNKCVGGCCPKNCCSSYKLGKIVINKLNDVNQLLEQRKGFDAVVDRLPRAQVEEKQIGKTVGLDSMFHKVWSWVRDENLGIIGLYGAGGVGKTTLLKKINNEFSKKTHGFDLVIWADVSRDGNTERVQDEILKRLGFSDTFTSRDEKATEIFRVLSKTAFVLLLDDLWRPLDLSTLGVPDPHNQSKSSKVIFTTRFEDVCGDMEADKKIRVGFLSQKDAWELFQMKVGKETLNLHPDIPKLAMDAARECGGLPVALVTIGRAMACKKTLREWKQALEALKKAPSKISGMGNSVFPRLKLSYDSLSNDTIRSCFIYCSLYPGDIWVESLVDLWIGEGLLNQFDNIFDARNEGRDIIASLKLVCLLESSFNEEFVRMHDVIRDMALWIDRERGSKMDKIVVHEDDELIEGGGISKWKEAERISLSGNAIKEKLNEKPTCPNLLTLVARKINLKTFPSGFFQFMPILRVLDLSYNSGLTELPMEISSLVSLQFLDLCLTNIRELPINFKNLINLKFLKLRQMPLQMIPEQVISSLSMLQVLDMNYSGSTYQTTASGNVLAGGNEGLLAELECLDYLEDLRITIKSIPAFQLLQSSHKLGSCTFGLTLKFCDKLTSLPLSTLKDMKHLQILAIMSCVDLKEITSDYVGAPVPAHTNIVQNSKILWDKYFHNLIHVAIQKCHNILDLTWLICIPSLQRLIIDNCKSLEQVIICDYDHGSDIAELEENSSIFSRLQGLYLYNLPELKSLYRHTLPFHSLTVINVRSCRQLKKLPLDSNSAKNSLKKISAEKQWWDELEWDDDSTRLHFLPYLVPIVS